MKEALKKNLGVKDGKKKRRIFSSRAIMLNPNLAGNQYNAEIRRRAKIGFSGTILRKWLDFLDPFGGIRFFFAGKDSCVLRG